MMFFIKQVKNDAFKVDLHFLKLIFERVFAVAFYVEL